MGVRSLFNRIGTGMLMSNPGSVDVLGASLLFAAAVAATPLQFALAGTAAAVSAAHIWSSGRQPQFAPAPKN